MDLENESSSYYCYAGVRLGDDALPGRAHQRGAVVQADMAEHRQVDSHPDPPLLPRLQVAV